MSGHGMVFISHATEDNTRCAGLVKCLGEWGVSYWFETLPPDAGQQLSQQTQMALAESNVFLRICTAATARSFWTSFEMGTFLSLQAEEHRRGVNTRAVVSLILDAGYARQPFDHSGTLIDATATPQAQWLNDLRAALGLAPLADADATALRLDAVTPSATAMSRRKFVAGGVAGVAALAVAGSAGLLLHNHPWSPTKTAAPPKASTSPNGPRPQTDDPNLKWWFKTDYQTLTAPVVTNGMVLVGSTDNTSKSAYYARHAQGLTKVWRKLAKYATTANLTSTSVGGGVLYTLIGTGLDANLVALDVQSGNENWYDSALGAGIPVATNGLIFAGGIGGLNAYNPAGARVWGGVTTGGVTSYSIVDGIAYVSSLDVLNGPTAYYMCAIDTSRADAKFDTTTGVLAPQTQPLWTVQMPKRVNSRPAVANGIVVFGCDDTNVYALDAKTGAARWVFKTGNAVGAHPIIDGNKVYITPDDGTLYALDLNTNLSTGAALWKYATGTDKTGVGLNSSPVLVDGTLYFGSHTNAVIALDTATHEVVKQYKLAGVGTIPAIADGILYVTDDNYYLYAFTL